MTDSVERKSRVFGGLFEISFQFNFIINESCNEILSKYINDNIKFSNY